MIVAALYTGIREGELLGLQWPDIDFTKATITVRRSLAQVAGAFLLKEPKSKRSRRTVTVPAPVLLALNAHRQAMLAEAHDVRTGPVFITKTGNFIAKTNLIRKVFAPLLAKAGLPHFRFHDLRHTHASHLLAANVPLKDVSLRLGHASETLTLKTYTHLLPTAGENLRRTLETLYA
jgi:integrase